MVRILSSTECYIHFFVEIFSFVSSLSVNRLGDFLIANFQKIGIAVLRPKYKVKGIISLDPIQTFSNDRNLPSF